ncbi:hypothetical protein BACCAP_04421 [Pseudoflavonifractor capillosus ATCC 29799]|uniref:Uncharacterized protein n=1 Tax=Pseudoflavonifractor capillosus ATCC 29799 TaxID=411467 RepID=A6P1P9_9FIRM|nr:hypothetical protein BACCAP_04421 [Pseudoflavonifractor capillosus ATCC 29799]
MHPQPTQREGVRKNEFFLRPRYFSGERTTEVKTVEQGEHRERTLSLFHRFPVS